jgi:hypothetical protein
LHAMDRRGFISNLVRGGILVGLAATSGYLLLRKNENGGQCNSICNSCDSLKTCSKPEAVKLRQDNKTK